MSRLQAKFLFAFIIITSIIVSLLWIEKENKINEHLQHELDQVHVNYTAIYNDYHKLANVIFETKINTPEVIQIFQEANTNDKIKQDKIRKTLYTHLKKTYDLLKQYNIKQLHFHLPNNDSFLRFHRPNKYGDNLTTVRKTIAHANEVLSEVDGFEEGKIYNGYRFVYPLFDSEKKHIGSVEVSFSTLVMLSSYEKAYKDYANFLLPKKIVNEKVFEDEKSNYTHSFIKGFVIEKSIQNYNKNKKELVHRLSDKEQQKLQLALQKKQSIALYSKQYESFYLPVLNPIDQNIEGLFVIKQKHHYIPNKERNFYVISFIILFLISIAMYHFYRSYHYEKTLLDKSIRLQTIIQQADSGIAIMDLEGRFLNVNNVYIELLGYSKEEFLRLKCIDITYEENEGQAKSYLQEAKEKGSISKMHKICVKKDGTLINLEFSLTLLPSKKQFIGVINSMEDKLKLQELNDNLQEEVHKKLNELRLKDDMLLKQSKDASMGEMIDAVAHQWKGPLGVIKMLGQSIKLEYEINDIPQNSYVLESANKIEQQVDHLLETLDEFRSFFRPKTTAKEVSVETLINSVNILMKDELLKNTIEIEKAGELNTKINIIPNEFKHVLINLINNSRDAFLENNIKNRMIQYNITHNKEHVIITLCDNAGGIPKEVISHIFEANYTTKEQGTGTGIGLYVTKQILDKIGADIKVYNKDDGACFEIYIKKEQKDS